MALTYEPIATASLSGLSTYAFTSIPATYTDLRVIATCGTSLGDFAYWRFNSDTGTNYSKTNLYGNGTSVVSDRAGNSTYIFTGSDIALGTGSNKSLIMMDVFSYTAGIFKTVISNYNDDRNGSGEVNSTIACWRNTNAITSISLTLGGGTFTSGSRITLYGITAA